MEADAQLEVGDYFPPLIADPWHRAGCSRLVAPLDAGVVPD